MSDALRRFKNACFEAAFNASAGHIDKAEHFLELAMGQLRELRAEAQNAKTPAATGAELQRPQEGHR